MALGYFDDDLLRLVQAMTGAEPCASSDPEAWFPVNTNQAQQDAKRLCRGCPIRVACLEYALSHPQIDGVWGGTTPEQRYALRRSRSRFERKQRKEAGA